MIVAIVTFKLARRWTLEEAAAVFKSTAPKYLGKAGLLRKHYYIGEQGDRAGGIYFWSCKADAEACYTSDWRQTVAEKYGAAPEIFYADIPVTVDNVAQVIEAA